MIQESKYDRTRMKEKVSMRAKGSRHNMREFGLQVTEREKMYIVYIVIQLKYFFLIIKVHY